MAKIGIGLGLFALIALGFAGVTTLRATSAATLPSTVIAR